MHSAAVDLHLLQTFLCRSSETALLTLFSSQLTSIVTSPSNTSSVHYVCGSPVEVFLQEVRLFLSYIPIWFASQHSPHPVVTTIINRSLSNSSTLLACANIACVGFWHLTGVLFRKYGSRILSDAEPPEVDRR